MESLLGMQTLSLDLKSGVMTWSLEFELMSLESAFQSPDLGVWTWETLLGVPTWSFRVLTWSLDLKSGVQTLSLDIESGL